MKAFFSQKPSYVIVSLLLLISVACKETNGSLRLSKQERDEIIKNSEVPYVYLGSELSDIIKVVRQISNLPNNNKVQRVRELRDHMNSGCKIGLCDAVLAVLTEALVALDDNIKSEKLAAQLKDNIERLQSSALNIEVIQQDMRLQNDQTKENDMVDTQLQAQGMPITIEEEEGVRRNPIVEKIENSNVEFKINVKIDDDLKVKDKLTVSGKAKFKENAEFKNNVKIDGKLTVKDNLIAKDNFEVCGEAQFKTNVDMLEDLAVQKNLVVYNDTELVGNVEVGGNLSVQDDLVVCGDVEFKSNVDILQNLTVQENLIVYGDTELDGDVDIGSNLSVQDDLVICGDSEFKGGVTIQENLTVQEGIVVYGPVQFKSSIDGLVSNNIDLDNLSIQDNLVVCGDAEFKGSIVDVACDLVVDCNILLKDTNNPLMGNVLKDGARFIHNFGTDNTFVGKEAGNFMMTGNGKNTGLGAQALSSNTTGSFNTAVGQDALKVNTIGNRNIAIGGDALESNATGDFNTAVGNNALQNNTTEDHCTAVGFDALMNNSVGGRNNTGVGSRALRGNTTGFNNTAVGFATLVSNTVGQHNVGVGEGALGRNTNGVFNTAIGAHAFEENITGNRNAVVGTFALETSTVGDNNTVIGFRALGNHIGGNKNIGIGGDSGISLTSGNDNIYIGSDSGAAIESDQIRIGANQTDCFVQGIHGATVDSLTDLPVFVDSDGKLGTTTSSKKYKSNIVNMDATSDGLMNLRPVQFTYNHDTSHSPHYGLLAEEVAKTYPELVVRDSQGDVYSVRYHELPAMLLNELQKNRELIKVLQSKDQSNAIMVKELKSTVKDLLTEQHLSNASIKELLARIIALEELRNNKL